METLNLRRLEVRDVIHLLELSKSAGWPTTAGTWRTMLSIPEGVFYGHALAGGGIVSSAAVFNYGGLASLAMVLVRPSHRWKGLAQQAIAQCLAQLPPRTPVMLVSTPLGLPLYTKLGFKQVEATHRLIAAADALKPHKAGNGGAVRPFAKADFPGVLRADAEALGVERKGVLAAYVNQSDPCCVLPAGDTIAAFAAAKDLNGVRVIGPVIAPEAGTAMCLIERLLPHNGTLTQVEVPGGRADLLSLLEARGFTLENLSPILLLNGKTLPGRREHLFAIASRAYG